MRKLALSAGLAAVVAWAVIAQDAPAADQVASLSVRDGGLVAYVAGGDYLIVADGAQLQLYNLTDPSDPQDAASIVLDDSPVALEATSDFALVALPTDSSPDELLIIAPDRYSRGGFGIVNWLDVPDNPAQIVLSPDNRWALVYGDNGYVTMALSAADNIEVSAPVDTGDARVIDAALTNDRALLIREGANEVEVRNLTTSLRAQATPEALLLDGEATAIGVSSDGSLGAVTLADQQVVLFDPDTLETLQTVALEDGPVSDLRFLSQDGRTYLALMIDNRPAIMLLDVTDPADIGLPGSVGVGSGSVLAFAVSGDHLALSRGDAVLIFQLAGN